MRTLLCITIAVTVFTSQANAQSGAPSLLPGSITTGINLQWRQDGRVVDYTVRNPVTTWVVTEMTVIIEFKGVVPPSLPASVVKPAKPQQRKPGGNQLAWDDLIASGYRYVEQPETQLIKIIVLPSRVATSRLELKSESEVASIRISEARGRAPTMLENLRNRFAE